MQAIYSYLLLMTTIGFVAFLNVNGNPVPEDENIFCFQNHEPRGNYGPCDTPQVNPDDADGDNMFNTTEQCCALAGQGGGFTSNRNGKRCTSCTSVQGNENGDENVDGGWSDWGRWTDCSVTCGVGTKTKTRTCTNPVPANDGSECNGEESKSKECDMGSCVVDGNWGLWGPYVECSATCGRTATQTRTRQCDNPAPENGGTQCIGDSDQTRVCPDHPPCPIDGAWSEWGVWSDCSATCGDGIQLKQRACTNPAPQYGGQNCQGDSVEEKPCYIIACPIDGGWSDWGDWSSSCSATVCGESGLQLRQRFCNNPPPQNGGVYCKGSSYKHRQCTNRDACPVDGQWGEWGEYGECLETCGGSFRERRRECNNPAPRNGGAKCDGRTVNAQDCVDQPPCPTPSPEGSGGSGCGDDEDAECEGSGDDGVITTTANPCGHIDPVADYYYYDLCIKRIDIPEVPGNEDAVTPTPTPRDPTQPPQAPNDPFDYSSLYSSN